MAQQLNLFDPSLRPEQRWLRASTALILLVLMALLLWGASLALRQAARSTEQQAATREAELRTLSAALQATPDGAQMQTLEQLRQQLAQAQQWEIQMRTLPAAPAGQQVLEALAQASGDEIWLTQMQWQARDAQLSLEGRLMEPKRLPLYLRRLEAQPALRGQSFLRVQLRPAPDSVDAAVPGPAHFQLHSSPSLAGTQ
ncbi:hypothetical protein HNQ51_001926 [Inhella inkyongensis]|uniref:Uncharacterized protein n=1 Tax=Inhella inkyongensis TaxID=392593 RepID=A0A840S4Y3_9BURK|nr:PilN domain-containing protein [Inhella inkyongensis]MBB5204612.1 hypothetical protein [Inhella inkyongensis]